MKRKISNRWIKITGFSLIVVLFLGTATFAKVLMKAPDGRKVKVKFGTSQPDISAYRSPLESKVVDRRFYTDSATFLANEAYKISQTGFNDMIKASFPMAYKKPFHWILHQEAYFNARYLLSFVGARSHLGIHMVQGPYITLKALEFSRKNKLVRDRGERVYSNKDYLLSIILPQIYQKTGFPRAFDDASVTYIQYKSGDPRFVAPVNGQDVFDDPQSDKKGGWGVPSSYLSFYDQRWNHDLMDTTIDMGVMGNFMKRRSQWADYMFHSDHSGQSPADPNVKVTLMGNDAEEGFIGWALTTAIANTLLELKSAMFTDGKTLLGVNPMEYDPKKGLLYIPSEIEPDILWAGDLPERLWSMDLKDNTSRLWVQSTWIWGLSEFVKDTYRYSRKIYTNNPPVDGGLMERKIGYLAEALANMILTNIELMHLNDDGILISTWTPENGKGNKITMKDMSMALTSLRDMEQRWNAYEIYEEMAEKALEIMETNANFLVKVQGKDGSFYETYNAKTGKGLGANNLASPNWAALRTLIDAYYSLEEDKYLEAARKTFNLMNEKYWVEKHGVYRSRLGDDTVIITPYNVAITLAALREMMYTTPTQLLDPQMERYTRWWVQTVNMSGFMQSENYRTGEMFGSATNGDADADGIPNTTNAYGKYGTAPVVAGKVAINVGGDDNHVFWGMEEELHNINRYAKVKMGYSLKSAEEQAKIILPLKMPKFKGEMEREAMERYDGTVIPLPTSVPIKVGLGTVKNLTGKQIFQANCPICHGEHGEGITGVSLDKDMNISHGDMFKVPKFGRFEQLMPPWGVGNNDGFGGALTDAEIHKIVDYVQSDEFKANFKKVEDGQIIPGSAYKDVYHYLSRENIKAGGHKISTTEDIRRIATEQQKAAKKDLEWWENIPREVADAYLTLDDDKK